MFTLLNYRVKECDLEHWTPTAFSLLVSVLEAASANQLQGKGSSRFDSLHPQGHGVHTLGVMLQYTSLVDYYGPLISVIWDTFNGKSIQRISSVLVSEEHHRLRGDWGPNAMQWGSGHCTRERLCFSPLEAGKMLISPLETSLGWDLLFLNSVDIAVSLVTTLCYQIQMPFILELPQISPAEKTSREIQACGYPYVQVIMDRATVSISILFPNTSCYETVVLIVDTCQIIQD